jgi:hypothetical protein
MTGISRGRWRRASWMCLLTAACGGGRAAGTGGKPAPQTAKRVIPLAQALVLETAGPPPPDTSVSFIVGQPRTIVLRHGPPDNIEFAELSFPPSAFADSGREVRVDLHPRPGIYGLDVTTSLPIREGASLVFKYARYFSAPARARAVYGSDVAYERALAIGVLQPNGQLTFLPSTRPASDNLRAPLATPGSYLVAAPQ